MDKFQYLDNLLFYVTSRGRRGNLYFNFRDKRGNEKSGYNFMKLLSHFFKTLYSSEIGAKRFFLILYIPIFVATIVIGISLIIIAQDKSVYITNPGWTSIFMMEFILIVVLGLFFTFSVKMYSIIALRSLAIAPYLVIDRSNDKNIYKNLNANNKL